MNFELKGLGSEGDVYTNYHLVSYYQEEFIGLKLPIAILTLKTTLEAISEIILDSEISINLTSNDGNIYDIRYTIKDFVEMETSDGVNSVITLYLLHKEKEYAKTYKQECLEMSSLEAMKQVLSEIEIGFTYKDTEESFKYLQEEQNTQKWIRPNTSIKAFLKDLVKHTYLAEDDTILSAITLQGFRVASLKNLMDTKRKSVKLILSRFPEKSADVYRVMQYETNNALMSKKLLSEEDCVFNVVDNKVEVYDYKGNKLEVSPEFKDNTTSLVDNINQHSKWYSAQIRNKSAWLALSATDLVIELTSGNLRYDVNILDDVEILLDSQKSYQGREGRYIISKKYIGLSPNSSYTYLVLKRVPKDYFVKVVNND